MSTTPREVLPGFPPEETILVESERARGVFTAALLQAREPERYEQAAAMLAEGSLSQRDIARSLRMSRNSVAAVYKRELAAGRVEPARKQLAGGFALLAAKSQERLLEAIDDDEQRIPARDLAIIAAVAVDKHQLLSGSPTEIVEHRDGPTVRNFDQWFETLPRAEVIDAGNGIAGGNSGAKGDDRPALIEGCPPDPQDQSESTEDAPC